MRVVRRSASALILIVISAVSIASFAALLHILRLPPAARSLSDVALGSYSFLSTLESQKASFSELKCRAAESCQPGERAGAPALGWRLLAHARMWQLTGESKYKVRLDEDFNKWKERANGWDELWSLHQLYEVYRLTGDEQFLGWFWGRVALLQRLAEDSYSRDRPADQTEPMLVATVIRELAQASRALRESRSVFLLRKWEQFAPGASSTSDVNRMADDLAALAGSLLIRLAAKLPHNEQSLTDSLQGRYQYVCWEEWARSALYTATGDAKYLADIKRFFRQASFRSLGRDKLRYHSLQSILPCIHTLLELRSEDSEFEPTARHLLQQITESSWDSPYTPVCEGDSALYSFPLRTREDRCPANIKSGADNSWFVFLIDESLAEQKDTV